MRAIVKPWSEINKSWDHLKIYCNQLIPIYKIYKKNWYYHSEDGFGFSGNWIDIINEKEWDAEIYALLLIESGVIYE